METRIGESPKTVPSSEALSLTQMTRSQLCTLSVILKGHRTRYSRDSFRIFAMQTVLSAPRPPLSASVSVVRSGAWSSREFVKSVSTIPIFIVHPQWNCLGSLATSVPRPGGFSCAVADVLVKGRRSMARRWSFPRPSTQSLEALHGTDVTMIEPSSRNDIIRVASCCSTSERRTPN